MMDEGSDSSNFTESIVQSSSAIRFIEVTLHTRARARAHTHTKYTHAGVRTHIGARENTRRRAREPTHIHTHAQAHACTVIEQLSLSEFISIQTIELYQKLKIE